MLCHHQFMPWDVIYLGFLFCAVLSSLSIPPPEPTAGGENLAPPAEEVGCILSLVLRCSAPPERSVFYAESRLAEIVLVNVSRPYCRSCGVCLLSCLLSWRVIACKWALPTYVAFLMVLYFWPYVLSKLVSMACVAFRLDFMAGDRVIFIRARRFQVAFRTCVVFKLVSLACVAFKLFTRGVAPSS